ncbi:hypothetical protein [Pseudoxanthomonas beigongshangi]
MNIGRIFANALVRRIAYVLAAMALAWMGIGRASAAANVSVCTALTCDQGQARAAAEGRAPGVCAGEWGGGETSDIQQRIDSGFDWQLIVLCKSRTGSALGWKTVVEPYGGKCMARAPYVGAPPVSTVQTTPRNGSISCVNGCDAVLNNNGDGTWTGDYGLGQACTAESSKTTCEHMAGYHWNAWNQTCEPTEQKCGTNQMKDATTGECRDACPEGMVVNQQGQCETAKEECPAGNIKSPEGACLPGENQCASGEARRDNGTCGKDSDGDGKADEDDDDPDNDPDKETASGGDNCNAPPSCSGSAILCMQVKIQWRIDCNTRKHRNVSGGACAAMPVCTGDNCDAVEYSQLLMQWRTACATEKLAARNGDGGSTGGQPDWTKVTGDGTEGAGEEPDGPVKVVTGDPTSRLDMGGFGGGGGSCPQLGVINLPFGVAFDLNSIPWACDLFYMTRVFNLLLAAFLGTLILMGKL